MSAAHPESFFPELSNDRLRIIASALLEVRSDTFRAMNTPLDCNYTRESAAFGRSRNMLIQMCQEKSHGWLSLMHAGMDITFGIGPVPCRYFRDDASAPEKKGLFRRNDVDDLFADDDRQPVMWRFVVEKALTEHDEDRVLFAGYNVYQEKIAEWQYLESAPTLHSVGDDIPAPALLPKVSVGLHEDSDTAAKDGTSK